MANLCPGDLILAIEGEAAVDMLHCDAQNKIKEATNQLNLSVERSAAVSRGVWARRTQV